MRILTAALILTTLLATRPASAQDNPVNRDSGLHLTIFRSPATGVEWRSGHAGIHAGFYPTILTRDGTSANTNFIRAGATYYAKPDGSTLYVTASAMFSLDRDWKHGALTEAGYRLKVYRTLHGRLGAAVLTTIDGEVRLNPTIGMDVRVGGGR